MEPIFLSSAAFSSISLILSVVATLVIVIGIVVFLTYIADNPKEFTPEEIASIREQIADAEFNAAEFDAASNDDSTNTNQKG